MRNDRSLEDLLARLRDVWSQYIESKRQFLVVAERCCVRGWPDKRGDIRSAFRVQELYCQLERLRLEHLIATRKPDASFLALDSLSAVSKIIHNQWTDADEDALRGASDEYLSLSQEIEKYRAVVDPTASSGPYQDALRDPEYAAARQAAAAAITACDKQLASELAAGR